MLKAQFIPYQLRFNFTAITSRASMNVKDTFFIKLTDEENTTNIGIGEVAMFRGLSADDIPEFLQMLKNCCEGIASINIKEIPSSAIRFGIETAMADMENGGRMIPFNNSMEWSIPINGLIWMGDRQTMIERIRQKIGEGYRCIKLKIGGINFEDELELLRMIRQQFSADMLELRLDANGGFAPVEALRKIDRLAKYNIHSLEQPIKSNQPEKMALICEQSPIPIALDEDLIGITQRVVKYQLLDYVRPAYIILKPSLCGGFKEADEWIEAAESMNIGWWGTSALESNVGLNAIARWLLNKSTDMPQGLGTGQLYTNNIPSPLEVKNCALTVNSQKKWEISRLF